MTTTSQITNDKIFNVFNSSVDQKSKNPKHQQILHELFNNSVLHIPLMSTVCSMTITGSLNILSYQLHDPHRLDMKDRSYLGIER